MSRLIRTFILWVLVVSAFAGDYGEVWLKRPFTGFCKVTGISTATPMRVTLGNTCGLANDETILVNAVRGATRANVHAEVDDATRFNDLARTVKNLAPDGLSFDLYNIATPPTPVPGTVDGSCVGVPSTHAGNCAYINDGRVSLATKYFMNPHPVLFFDGPTGVRTNQQLVTKATASTIPYNGMISLATGYAPAGRWGWEFNTGNGTTATQALMPYTWASAMKWKITGDATARANALFGLDNPDQILGTPACDETDGNCGAPDTWIMDYPMQFGKSLYQSYSLMRSEMTTLAKNKYLGFMLGDLPWYQGGINFSGTTLTKPVFGKLRSESAGTVNWTVGNTTITGNGTTFTDGKCVVGGIIVNNSDTTGRPFKILSINSNTSITLTAPVVHDGSNVANYSCGPSWAPGMLGFIWHQKHMQYNPLNDGKSTPYGGAAQSGGVISRYYNSLAGLYQDGFNNHSVVRSVGSVQLGLSTCWDTVLGCLLASIYDEFLSNDAMPYNLDMWTGFNYAGNTYIQQRVGGPLEEWAEMRTNSFTAGKAVDPLIGTDIREKLALSFIWSTTPTGSNQFPTADTNNTPPDVYRWQAVPMALASSPAALWARNVHYRLLNGGLFVGGTNYNASTANYAQGGNLVEQYLMYDPSVPAVAPVNTTQHFLTSNHDACVAWYGAAMCTIPDVRKISVSRSDWTSTASKTFVNCAGWGLRDHQTGDLGDCQYHIFRNVPLTGPDDASMLGYDPNLIAKTAKRRNHVLVGGVANSWSRGDGGLESQYYGVQTPWSYGDVNAMYVRGNNAALYKPGANITASERQIYDLKGGGQNYIVEHVVITTSVARTIQGQYHYKLNGCGTASASSCVTVNNTTKVASNIQGTARLNTRVFGISGTMDLKTDIGTLTNGSYTDGAGDTFRWFVEPASGAVTSAEYMVVHQPTTNPATVLPTQVQGTSGIFRTLEIQDATNPKVLALTALGATASTVTLNTTHAAIGRYVITGLVPGAYNRCVVRTGENTCTFASASGTITVSPSNTWYVAAGSSGNGSIGSPWALSTALSGAGGAILPGDTVHLRGGTYTGHNVATLNGSADSPITFRPYQSETVIFDRAALTDGDNASLKVDASASYLTFLGFEFTNSNTDRRSAFDTSNPTDMRPNGFESFGHHITFANNVIHDTGTGLSAWSTGATADDSLFYGNIIFGNGWQSANPTERGHGHGAYMQNQATGSKTLRENISFWNFNQGFQMYGSGDTGVYVSGFNLDKNTVFMNGAPSLPGLDRQILVGAGQFCDNNTLTDNQVYTPIGSALQAVNLGYLNSLFCRAYTVTNNYFIGGETRIVKQRSTSPTANSVFTGNASYGTVGWEDGSYLTGWSQDFTGSGTVQSGNTQITVRPSANVITVQPNEFETNRCTVTVYNWQNLNSIDVDLSTCLDYGVAYKVTDVQNWGGAPVLTGTYRTGYVSIPTTGTTVRILVGANPGTDFTQPVHTDKEFNVFIVQASGSTNFRSVVTRGVTAKSVTR